MEKDNSKNITDLKGELESLFNNCLDYLKQDQHEQVNELFTYFFKNDMRLKEKLAKAFMPGTEGKVVTPEIVNELVELQALHNSFHLNLFNAITDHLIEKFKEALDVMDNKSLEEGSHLSFEAQKLVRFYEIKLEKLMAPIDTFQGSTYNDLKESYKAVIGRRNEMIAQITQKVIEKEQDIMLEGQ